MPTELHLLEHKASLQIEIGCGNGRYLMELAKRLPGTNFLGIEQREKWYQKSNLLKQSLALQNVFFVASDAFQFIQDQVQSGRVQAFHMYFPDPWPKRKHRRRRLFISDFIKLLHDRLSGDGYIHLATDFEDYFKQMCSEIVKSSLSWKSMSQTPASRPFHGEIMTKYEQKYLRAGRPIYYLELIK